MSIENKDLLDSTVEGLKKVMGARGDDYVTVFITVLVGKEEDVLEAEFDIDERFGQDDLACKSVVIKLSDWKGREEREMNEDKTCKDCKYAFDIAVAPNDIWCDLDKLDYWEGKMACGQFAEREEEEEE